MYIRLGLKGLRVAEIDKDISAVMAPDGKAKITYKDVKLLPNVQSINLTARKQTADVDSDDGTDTLGICLGYDGTIQRTMFTPEEESMLLGETKLEDGTVVSKSTDEAPEYAVGFMCKLNDSTKYFACWILRAKFSVGDLTAESAGNNTLNPQSDTLSVTSSTRRSDDAWRFYKLVDTEAEALEYLKTDTIARLATASASTGD